MGLRKAWTRSRGLIRFARHIRGFLAEPITPEQASETITQGVEQREARFLRKLDVSIYANPKSPYRKLLEAAGCEYGDVARLVETDGVENALGKLEAAGVHLTFEEFKCRTPTVRGSQSFHFEPEDFNDHTFRAETMGRTSGTSGPPIPFGWSFALTVQWAPHWCVFFAANGAIGVPLIFWTPGNSGSIGPQLACAKFNQRVEDWFVSQDMTSLADRAYAGAKHWICRQFASFPRPSNVAYHDTAPVLNRVLGRLREREAVSICTTPSAAVRLSLAAQEQDVNLTGAVFLLGAEPLTPARRQAIESSGARATSLYGATEAVWAGGQCCFPQHADEVHVLRDLHAVISGSEPDPSVESDAPRLLFTSLAPVTSKVMLNTDIGDRGLIEYRRCDCLYDRMGCRQTIHTIRSSDKLTEFGVTIWVADVYHVLEDLMPRNYQASASDFQLIETRTPDGLPRYLLLVHPRVQAVNDQALAKLFLRELGQQKSYYGFMTSIWAREKVLEVYRRSPIATSRGKLLPFFRLRDPAVLPGILPAARGPGGRPPKGPV